MPVKQLIFIIFFVNIFGCRIKSNIDNSVASSLEYISKNDPYFNERLKDTVYLYSQNHDYISSEISTGHYYIVGEDWQSPIGKLAFNQLKPVEGP